MASNAPQPSSSLVAYLPAIYQDNPFVGQFLLAFEAILVGGHADQIESRPDLEPFHPGYGLEEKINRLAELFVPAITPHTPAATPDEFLPWLATWTAFTLRSDLAPDKQRTFLANIIPRYLWRGTKKNLEDMLAVFTLGTPTVEEMEAGGFQIGVHSTLGVDTYVGDNPPHFFTVTINLPTDLTEEERGRQIEITRAVIDLEKPAHTSYHLSFRGIPTLQVGVRSTVGVDTLLGDIPA